MSKYTTQVRWIVENATSDMEGQPISVRVNAASPKIFNFEYPIWIPSYKEVLQKKILMHYFNKEIGFETVALWKFYLEERLNLIMPYYNELYQTTVEEYDHMITEDRTETFTGDRAKTENSKYDSTASENFQGTGETTDTLTSNANRKELNSDLPQANYANVDYGTNMLEGEETATNTGKNNSTSTSDTSRSQGSTNNVTNNEDESYTRTNKGVSGVSLTDLLMKYRDSLINIDMMIVEELADLFMTIY